MAHSVDLPKKFQEIFIEIFMAEGAEELVQIDSNGAPSFEAAVAAWIGHSADWKQDERPKLMSAMELARGKMSFRIMIPDYVPLDDYARFVQDEFEKVNADVLVEKIYPFHVAVSAKNDSK